MVIQRRCVLPIKPSERNQKTPNLLGDFKGQQPDNKYKPLPIWNVARNVYRDSDGMVVSRPFYFPVSQAHTEVQGMFYDADNKLVYIADGNVYRDFQLEFNTTPTAPIRFDISRLRTVVATGGVPFVWIDEDNYYALPYTNVKALATFQGATKLRLVFVTYDDPHRLYVTEIGDISDTGQVIIDPRGVANDEWTEGFSIKNIPYEIVDLAELNQRVMVFTKKGIIPLEPGINENGFAPSLENMIHTDVLDVRVSRDEGQIHFLGPEGPKRLYFDKGFPTFASYPLTGIEKTLQDALFESEAAITTDAMRGLLYVKPNNHDELTYVYNFSAEHWTEWDGMINDCVSVSGTTYAGLEGGTNLYELRDDAGVETIEGEIKTGLTPLFGEEVRVRAKAGRLKYQKTGELELYVESSADEFLDTVLPVYAEAEDDTTFYFYAGDQGELFCLSICFRTKGRLVLNELVLKLALKIPRILQ